MIGMLSSVIFLEKLSDRININRLMKEEAGGNWLYSIDGLAPLEI